MISKSQKPTAAGLSAKVFNPDSLSVKVFWIGSIFFFSLSVANNWWYFLFVFGTLLFYTPIIVLHELGHAFADLILGGKVQYIQLGYPSRWQPQPLQGRFIGFPWRLYFPLTSGCVAADYYSPHLFRIKRALSIIGGPLANVVALIAPYFVLALLGENGPSANGPIFPILTVWTILNGYIIFVSVWPNHWTLRARTPRNSNDSRLLWQTFHFTDSQIRDFIESALIRREYASCEARHKDKPLDDLIKVTDHPDADAGSICYAVARLGKEKHNRLFEYLYRYAQLPGMPPSHVVQVIDDFLTRQLAEGPFVEASIIDKLSLKLLEYEDTPSTRGTRGSLLIDHGRVEEGRAILLDVLSKSSKPHEQAYSSIFLALAEKQQGNLTSARELAQKAAKIHPNCEALKRVSDLLPLQTEERKAR